MRLGLGTVQFGLDYGIANRGGRTPAAAVADILAAAYGHGLRVLDTAHLYGESEAVLGRTRPAGEWRLVTKTPKFAGLDAADAVAALNAALAQSLSKLSTPSVAGLMAHDADDLLGPAGPALWAAMEAARDAGKVGRIGSSVYTGAQIDALLDLYPIEIVQLPYSLLDQRAAQQGHLERLRKRGVEIHVRSIFLQGLLLMDPDAVPATLSDVAPRLRQVRASLAEAGLAPLEGALAAVLARPEIDAAVVGVCSRDELEEIMAAYDKVKANPPDVDYSAFALTDPTILNPGLWATRTPAAN